MEESTEHTESFGALIEPPPVPFSFDAPGWYVLGLLLIIILITLIVIAFNKYKANAYRREALKSFKEIVLMKQVNSSIILLEVHNLLNRIALKITKSRYSASLKGIDWLTFLNSTCQKSNFGQADASLMERGIYEQKDIDKNDLEMHLKKIKYWIIHHRRKSDGY